MRPQETLAPSAVFPLSFSVSLRCLPLGMQEELVSVCPQELWRLAVTAEVWQAMTRKGNGENRNPEERFLATVLKECRI